MTEQYEDGDFMDRALHRAILQELRAVYPRTINYQSLVGEQRLVKITALYYLSQHELIDVVWSREIGSQPRPMMTRITEKGLDLIADDGGLGAILGVVTIKLHSDSIRDLLSQRIQELVTDPEEQSSLTQAIRTLPAKSLETLAEKLVEKGLDVGLAAAPIAGTWLIQLVRSLGA